MKINLIYFSCGRDQEMLNRSIDSFRRNAEFNRVIVASDNNDPVTIRLPDVEYIEKESSSEKLYGLENIASMHDIFTEIAEGCDYILKVDSDIVCCSDYAFKRLDQFRWDGYGGFPMAVEAMIPPGHFNGNAYFIASHVAKLLGGKLKEETYQEIVSQWAWMNYPEDMVTSSLLACFTTNVKVEWTAQNRDGLYLFDIFLTRVAEKSLATIEKYGFAHCRTSPRVHEYIYKKLYE